MLKQVSSVRKDAEDKQIVYKSIVKRANEFKLFY